jgi:hypothetical protein
MKLFLILNISVRVSQYPVFMHSDFFLLGKLETFSTGSMFLFENLFCSQVDIYFREESLRPVIWNQFVVLIIHHICQFWFFILSLTYFFCDVNFGLSLILCCPLLSHYEGTLTGKRAVVT